MTVLEIKHSKMAENTVPQCKCFYLFKMFNSEISKQTEQTHGYLNRVAKGLKNYRNKDSY